MIQARAAGPAIVDQLEQTGNVGEDPRLGELGQHGLHEALLPLDALEVGPGALAGAHVGQRLLARGADAGDDLLPDVAALGETHAIAQQPGFVRQIVRAEINVEQRRARFDARDVELIPADGADTALAFRPIQRVSI